jgi:hypothetical protein
MTQNTTSAAPPPTRFSERDERYIRRSFVSLDELARRCQMTSVELRSWQASGRFPYPTYVSADGSEWYCPAYAVMVRRARSRQLDLKALFVVDFDRQLRTLQRREPEIVRLLQIDSGGEDASPEAVIESHWESFLSGQFGACLKVPWVNCMIHKVRLMHRIDLLVADPRTENVAWRAQLRASVNALDRLEQPFAEWDRIRFGGPVTRDTRIVATRRRFPGVFGSKVKDPVRTQGDPPSATGPEPSPEPC